jgi:acetylornithine deacetylase
MPALIAFGWRKESRCFWAWTSSNEGAPESHAEGSPQGVARVECYLNPADDRKRCHLSEDGFSVLDTVPRMRSSRPNMDVLERTRQLVAIPSISGDEGRVGSYVAEALEAEGWHVTRQEVPPDGDGTSRPTRWNVLALSEPGIEPEVVFTTHLDTVPPFIDVTEDSEFLYGRGTCDAKGVFAAEWSAANLLRSQGIKRIGLLGVVSEETSSIGAKVAHEILPRAKFIIDGEPTELRMASGAKGILSLSIKAKGKAAHSAYPELGVSAVHALIHALRRVLEADYPSESQFGETTVNVGRIEGGLAPNVIAPSASAQVLIRLGAPSHAVLSVVEACLGDAFELEIRSRSEPQEIYVPGNQGGDVVRFGSDVPHLRRIGTPLLVGPGSIHDAHTSHEKIRKADLHAAVELYAELGRSLSRGS